jgi:hypothetical protein
MSEEVLTVAELERLLAEVKVPGELTRAMLRAALASACRQTRALEAEVARLRGEVVRRDDRIAELLSRWVEDSLRLRHEVHDDDGDA